MAEISAAMPIKAGDFIRVKRHADFRPGQDGMVAVPPDADGYMGMVFAYDRYNQPVSPLCEGIESWHVDEVDLATLDR